MIKANVTRVKFQQATTLNEEERRQRDAVIKAENEQLKAEREEREKKEKLLKDRETRKNRYKEVWDPTWAKHEKKFTVTTKLKPGASAWKPLSPLSRLPLISNSQNQKSLSTLHASKSHAQLPQRFGATQSLMPTSMQKTESVRTLSRTRMMKLTDRLFNHTS